MYQWDCSALDSENGTEFYSLPDFSNIGVSITEPSEDSVLYIYPIPTTLNCSGTVSAVGYSYTVGTNQLDTEQWVFTLLILERSAQSFTVTDVINIHDTPTNQTCGFVVTGLRPTRGYWLCDALKILNRTDQFSLPLPNFAFGIISTTDVGLFGFDTLFHSKLLVEHYRVGRAGQPVLRVGDTVTMENMVTDRTLRAFQFYIGKVFWVEFLFDM